MSVPDSLFPQRVNFARAVNTGADTVGRVVTDPFSSPVIYYSVPVNIQQTGGGKEVDIQGRKIEQHIHNIFTKTRMKLLNGDYCLFGRRAFVVQADSDVAELGILYIVQALELVTAPLF